MRALLLAVGILVLAATPAFAHTEFDPDEAAPGSVVVVTLNAADERDDAAIVKVELFPPDDFAVPVADPTAATAGWTATVFEDRVEWTGPPADGDQSFTVTLGPLPDQETRLQFKVLETYDSGDIDRWIEDYPIDGAEPEMPGPILDLVPGAAGTVPEATVALAPDTTLEVTPLQTTETTTVATAGAGTDDDDDSATPTIIVVMVIGVVAIGAGIFLIRRRR
jgi:uncharacterized protein YcnI